MLDDLESKAPTHQLPLGILHPLLVARMWLNEEIQKNGAGNDPQRSPDNARAKLRSWVRRAVPSAKKIA